MTALLVGLASLVAVAAAIRSTWSPCGLSMLSTITPIGERGRNHRFYSTAAWFVLGAALGGATLGAGAALLALGVGALDLSGSAALGAAAVLAAVTIAFVLIGLCIRLLRRVNYDRVFGRLTCVFMFVAGVLLLFFIAPAIPLILIAGSVVQFVRLSLAKPPQPVEAHA